LVAVAAASRSERVSMRVWLILFLVVTDAAICGFAQTKTQKVNRSDAQRRLDERAPTWLKVFHVTGIGIARIENGNIAWTSFYGDQVPGGPSASEKTGSGSVSITDPLPRSGFRNEIPIILKEIRGDSGESVWQM
jgi:hypothetical protein